jgi:hypothetical protein
MIEEAVLREAVEREFDKPLARIPYGRQIGRALAEAAKAELVCLAPARTDTRWWWDYCRHGEVRFLRGRVRFAGERSGARFPSAVIVFGPRARTDALGYWDVNRGELTFSPVRLGP